MDGLRPDIAAAATRMSTATGAKREIRKLVEHLWESEQVERMTSGVYGNGIGLVVLTDRRLFFLKDGWVSQTSEDFLLERVSSIQWSSGVMTGSIIVFASGNKAEIKQVPKADGKDIVDLIRARLAGSVVPARPAPGHGVPGQVPHPSPDDVFQKLRQLGELRDAGVVTPAEFEVKKAELLARI
ncbi:MAG TPA: PH domain-containing protein [Nocardioidaceae bacterium]|nr:PH domain-containing protein [Nocardioidaceae bacterium]